MKDDTDYDFLEAEGQSSLLELIFDEGPLLGAYGFFVSEHQLPREFDDRVELHSGAAYLRIGGPLPTQIPFTPDAVGIDMAERFGHAMERLYHPRPAQRQRPDATQ